MGAASGCSSASSTGAMDDTSPLSADGSGCAPSGAGVTPSSGEVARRTEDFIDSIGMSLYASELDKGELSAIGIRHYRSSLQTTSATSINDAFRAHGLRGNFLGTGNQNPTIAAEVAAVKAIVPGAIDIFEGPN